jgi:hypothetical protein
LAFGCIGNGLVFGKMYCLLTKDYWGWTRGMREG